MLYCCSFRRLLRYSVDPLSCAAAGQVPGPHKPCWVRITKPASKVAARVVQRCSDRAYAIDAKRGHRLTTAKSAIMATPALTPRRGTVFQGKDDDDSPRSSTHAPSPAMALQHVLSVLKKKWMLYPTLVQTTCTCSYLVKPAFGPGNSFAAYALDAVRVSGVLQLI